MAKKESKEKTPARTLKVVGGQGKKDNAGDGDRSAIDFASVRALARIATEFDLEEIEVNGAGHLRVRRGVAREVGAVASVRRRAPSPRPIALTPPVEAKGEAGTFVSSPFVGTFYGAPSPEAPPFVEVGTVGAQGPGGLHRRGDEADERDRGRVRRAGRRDPRQERRARRVRPAPHPRFEVLISRV